MAMEKTDKNFYVIMQHDNKPLTFSDNVVLVYQTTADAMRNFNPKYDKAIITLEQYKNTKAYIDYNVFSIEI